MKKSILFLAMLLCSLAASAKVINAVPAGDISWYLKQAEAGDIIEMADGTYDEAYEITFSVENLTIKAAEGAKPVIALTGEWTSLTLAATTTFEGITFDGGGVAYYPITIEGENTGIFTFNNCEFKNYQYYAISNNNAITKTNVNSVVVNNCIFHDGGSAIYMNDQAACANLTVQNTTIYNFAGVDRYKAAIHIAEVASNATFATQTLIDHVTIYNIQTSASEGAITIANASKTTISNSIIASPEQKHIDSYNVPAEATIQNCLVYNQHLDDVWTSIITNADPMFVDAANGNFQLYGNSPAVGAGTAGSNLGDPRWGVKAGLQPGNGALKKAVAAAALGATIELGDGEYVETSSIDFNKEGLIIKAADGTKPVIKASSYLKHNATTTFIGITFDGQSTAEYTTYSYETNTEKNLTFINCEFKAYTNSCVTLGSAANVNQLTISGCTFDGGNTTPAAIKSSGIITTCQIENSEIKGHTEFGFVANSSSAHTDELTINNTLIHDCGYSAVYVTKASNSSAKQSCSSFELTNSTIYNIGNDTKDYGAVDIRDNANIASTQQVLIDHVTLYNFTTKDWYGGFMIYQSGNATISNCIVSNPASGKNGYHVYANAKVTNSLYYNCNITSGAQQNANINATPLFMDAANANFQLYANSPAVGAGTDMSNLGDPRWGVSAKVLGKRIAVSPTDVASLPWMIQSHESNVKAGDTIVMASGTYELSSFEFTKQGLVIMAAEDATPVIATKAEQYLKIVATTTFDGITFDGQNIAKYAIRPTDASAKNLTLRNCEFTNYLRYNIYGADGTHLDSLFVDNCLFHHSASAIYFPASNLADNVPGCSYAKITNSTFHNIIINDYVATIDIQENNNAKETGNTEVEIDHVTIYNFSSTAKSAIKVYKSGKTNITNSIVANPNAPAEGETIYSYYIYDGAKVQNSLSFNAKGQWASNAYTDTIHADPLFVDAANANFMLSANSPAVGAGTNGSNLGDPRWGVEEPAFITLTTGNNDAVIAANIGKTVDVVIERSFTANDGYYTLCVPFNMPASVIGKAYSLGTITEHVAGKGININLEEVSELSAGMPYLVLPKEDMTQLVVEDVTILEDHAEGQGVSNDELNVQIFFQGYYSAPAAPENQTNGTTQYYVGNNGYLYNDVVDIRGLCGLFTITDTEGNPAKVRARVVTREDAATGFENITNGENTTIKLIENGQLIIIRNGEKFNVQGQRLKANRRIGE